MSVLLVEDNPDHAELTCRALRGITSDIQWVEDGEEALDVLYGRGGYADGAGCPRPELILLDIKLPKMDGHEVLRRIKSDATLQAIPVVMVTTSAWKDEVASCYRMGASSYIAKPVRPTDFAELLARLGLLPPPAEASPSAGAGTRENE